MKKKKKKKRKEKRKKNQFLSIKILVGILLISTAVDTILSRENAAYLLALYHGSIKKNVDRTKKPIKKKLLQ